MLKFRTRGSSRSFLARAQRNSAHLLAHRGITLFFEFKVDKRKLTKEQEQTIALLREVGFEVFLIDSAREAIGICKEVFGL
jgi:hypothetical protein